MKCRGILLDTNRSGSLYNHSLIHYQGSKLLDRFEAEAPERQLQLIKQELRKTWPLIDLEFWDPYAEEFMASHNGLDGYCLVIFSDSPIQSKEIH